MVPPSYIKASVSNYLCPPVQFLNWTAFYFSRFWLTHLSVSLALALLVVDPVVLPSRRARGVNCPNGLVIRLCSGKVTSESFNATLQTSSAPAFSLVYGFSSRELSYFS